MTPRRILLELDAAYSLEMLRARTMEHEVTCRDLGGFFDHVWSVHPAVGASPEHSGASAVGPIGTTRLAPRHTVIEGRVGRYAWLRSLPRLNFAVAQTGLILRLLRLMKAERVSIVRAGDAYYLSLLGLMLARLRGASLVVRVNSNQDSIYAATGDLAYPRVLPSRCLEQRVARLVLQRADLVAAASQNNLEFALVNGARPERSTIFRYGTWVDPLHFRIDPSERASVRPEIGLGDRPFLIIVGRLEPVKHPQDVLAVLERAKHHRPDLAALFVGDGAMRSELESKAKEMGLDEDVVFVGNRDQQWIVRALTAASVVLSPLTGRALVEACLSGSPVVAYDVEWHSEIVKSGRTGILVPYRDTEAMAGAVVTLLADSSLSASMGQRSRARTLEMMDPDRLMAHERSEYEKLLGSPGRSGPTHQCL